MMLKLGEDAATHDEIRQGKTKDRCKTRHTMLLLEAKQGRCYDRGLEIPRARFGDVEGSASGKRATREHQCSRSGLLWVLKLR